MAFKTRYLKKRTVENKEDHIFVFFLECGIAVFIQYIKRIVIVEPNNNFFRRSLILVEYNLDSVVECLAVFWVLVICRDCW